MFAAKNKQGEVMLAESCSSCEKSDKQLVDEVKAGSQESFEQLVSRYSSKAFSLAFRLTRNQQDAEEVLHDAFVSVYRKLDLFEGKSAFSSWLYRITVNAALMKLRRRKLNYTISMEEVSQEIRESWKCEKSEKDAPDKMTLRGELHNGLESAIVKLPDDYRAVFILRDVDGLSNREVGSILSISIPAVKSRLHRARLMLRRRLQKMFDDYNGVEQAEESQVLVNTK